MSNIEKPIIGAVDIDSPPTETKPIIRSEIFKSLGFDGTSWTGPLGHLGFDSKSIEIIHKARADLDLIPIHGRKPDRIDLFNIAGITTVLALAGYDSEKELFESLLEDEIALTRRYQAMYRSKIRNTNGISNENTKYTRDSFGSVQQIAKELFDKRPELTPLKNAASSKFQKWSRKNACRYCGKIVSTRKNSEFYCDEICIALKRINKDHAHFYRIKNIERLNDDDYKETVSIPLSSYNEKYGKNVSLKEFTVSLKDMVMQSHCLTKEAFYFYAYYISARRNKSTYLTYFDMMAKAGDEIKEWRGIKALMLEKESCDLENRVSGIFKSSLKEFIKSNILPQDKESAIFKIYDGLGMETVQFRSHPKTVAITVLCAILEKIGVNYDRKVFFEKIGMSYATVWKKIGAAKNLIENPEKYRKPVEKQASKKKETPVAEQNPVVTPSPIIKVPAAPIEIAVPAPIIEVPAAPVVKTIFEEVVKAPVVENKGFVTSEELASFKQSMLADIEKMLHKPAVEKKIEPVPERKVGTVYTGFDKAEKKGTSKGHAIYIDLNNLFYIAKKQLCVRFDMEKFVKMINVALIAVDDKYDEKSIIFARIYIGKQLQGLKNVFDNEFVTSKTKDISSIFSWWWPAERKFENNIEKNQDIDTFLVADAIEDMIVNKEKINHVILGSSDKDLVPVLERARKMGMKTSVIGYKKYTPASINALATKVYYLD